jgi:hypothetical protein
VGKVLGVKLLKGEAMGEHVDHLGNTDARAFDGEFTACAVRTGFKVFILYSMSIVASRL